MTREEFQQYAKEIRILDGATGSNLLAAGMPWGVCPELWILEHKEVLQSLQRAYIQAGSQIIYAPTFGANPLSLASHGLDKEVERLNRTLLSYSQELTDGRVLVGGDLSSTGMLLEPFGDRTCEEAREAYCRQIALLTDAGADLLAIETMIQLDDALTAVKAARSISPLPVLCTLSVDERGKTLTGDDLLASVKQLEAAGADAVGVNCSLGPEGLLSLMEGIRSAVSLPVIAKPNAGLPKTGPDGKAVYEMSPETFAGHMKALADAGATLLGGCCGTTPDHIRALAAAVQ